MVSYNEERNTIKQNDHENHSMKEKTVSHNETVSLSFLKKIQVETNEQMSKTCECTGEPNRADQAENPEQERADMLD